MVLQLFILQGQTIDEVPRVNYSLTTVKLKCLWHICVCKYMYDCVCVSVSKFNFIMENTSKVYKANKNMSRYADWEASTHDSVNVGQSCSVSACFQVRPCLPVYSICWLGSDPLMRQQWGWRFGAEIHLSSRIQQLAWCLLYLLCLHKSLHFCLCSLSSDILC